MRPGESFAVSRCPARAAFIATCGICAARRRPRRRRIRRRRWWRRQSGCGSADLPAAPAAAASCSPAPIASRCRAAPMATITALGEPQTLTVTADPGVTLTPAQRTAATEYHGEGRQAAALVHRRAGAGERHAHARRRRSSARWSTRRPTSSCWTRRAASISACWRSCAQLRGDETLRGLESGDPSSIQDRVNSAVQGARGLTGAPTGTQQRNYEHRQRGSDGADQRAANARGRAAEVRAATRGGGRALYAGPHSWSVDSRRGSVRRRFTAKVQDEGS